MTNDIQPIAPVYRYFTEDLLTGQKIAELDFRDVTYKLGLNSPGTFTGSLVVKDIGNATNLHNATMVGNTALYIVKNGVCVWGGIIWEREYKPNDKRLEVSASEFTSYLHHRKIWKTWNHEFGATVHFNEDTELWEVIFDYGSSVDVKPGSTVKLDFYEVENFRYNGYYRVAINPAPTKAGFNMAGGAAVADITSMEYSLGEVVFRTKENHGYSTGDVVKVNLTMVDGDDTGMNFGDVKITAPGGPASNLFTITTSTPDSGPVVVEGTAMRALPEGTYESVTVGVRQDTFDYVRSLIEGTFEDFVGTDFPNIYIEPGISKSLNVIAKEAFGGYSIIKTDGPHGLAVGQAVQVRDVGPDFDGEFEILGVEEGESLVYLNGGNLAETPVAPIHKILEKVRQMDGMATITTSSAHGIVAGQHITVDAGFMYPDLSGTWEVHSVPNATTLRYYTGSGISYPQTTLTDATATRLSNVNAVIAARIKNNIATLTTAEPHGFLVGQNVTMTGVNRSIKVIEKSLDGPSGVAAIQTEGTHGLAVGQQVILSGLSDVVSVNSVASTTSETTFTTNNPHNLRVGDSLSVYGTDDFKIINKQISSNVARLTTQYPHNLDVGTEITVTSLTDNYMITNHKIEEGVATLTTSVAHNVAVNDEITVGGIWDVYDVITKSADNGVITLTTKLPHNLLEDQKIGVNGLGLPYDGNVTVTAVTDQRVVYKVDSKHLEDTVKAAGGTKASVPLTISEQKASGRIVATDSYLAGIYTVSAVTPTTIQYQRAGNKYVHTLGDTGNVSALSILNGVYETTSGSGTNSVTFAKVANNSASTAVPLAVKDDEPQPMFSAVSVYSGTKTVTGVSTKTFKVAETLANAVTREAVIYAAKPSIFNGTRTVSTVPASDRFTFNLAGYGYSMLEQGQTAVSVGTAVSIYNGTYAVTAVDNVNNTFSYNRIYQNLDEQQIQSRGTVDVNPIVIISTFGPYPGSADIGFTFPDNEYSGINIEPAMYRGFELKTVGEALDSYSNSINGFEYRVDCDYDADLDKFIKKFVIIPINFPNAPEDGSASPISRFGADKLVFEYPAGSVTSFSIVESAEESATRFFALGETDLGPDVGPYIGVASADDLLSGDRDGRRWPLLDASDTVDGIDDKNVLYSYANRFLSEMQPPFAEFKIAVNGSRPPYVGTYKPGQWCSIVVNDPWMQMRLGSDLEPRSDVLVRKIDSISVTVPEGVTYPESVTITLVAEWEVDKRGK